MHTVSDFCTRIRNSYLANHLKVDIPCSKLGKGLAEQLKNFGYIKNYVVVEDSRQGLMRIYLKYRKGKPSLRGIMPVSLSSCRRYCGAKDIPRVFSGFGLMILSTNQGILNGIEARQKNIGGELLMKVW